LSYTRVRVRTYYARSVRCQSPTVGDRSRPVGQEFVTGIAPRRRVACRLVMNAHSDWLAAAPVRRGWDRARGGGGGMRVRAAALATAALWAFGTGGVRSAEAGPEAFPEITEVLQGRIFDTKFDRDVVFLRRIREDFHRHWADFLEANLTEKEFVQVPDKMAKFLEKLAKSTAGTDDATTAEKLAVLVTDPVFYANTNAYRPDLLTAAARTLIGLGPKGCQAFAGPSVWRITGRTRSAWSCLRRWPGSRARGIPKCRPAWPLWRSRSRRSGAGRFRGAHGWRSASCWRCRAGGGGASFHARAGGDGGSGAVP